MGKCHNFFNPSVSFADSSLYTREPGRYRIRKAMLYGGIGLC